MRNPSKLDTNRRKVREGWEATFAEWEEATRKIKVSLDYGDYLGALHHSSDYIGAVLQHAWRTWLYLWFPRRVLEGTALYYLWKAYVLS